VTLRVDEQDIELLRLAMGDAAEHLADQLEYHDDYEPTDRKAIEARQYSYLEFARDLAHV
jgi:hypothetical protein